MTRKLALATAPLPEFRSDEAAAEYFWRRTVAELWNQPTESNPAGAAKALKKAIREHHAAAKSSISIRLAPEQITTAR